MIPQDITHHIRRSCYQRGSPWQDPAGNWTTRGPPDHRKETQTVVVWSCLQLISSGQNDLARHSEKGKETRQTEEDLGRQHQGMDRPGVRQVQEGSGEQGKMKKTAKSSVALQRPSRLRNRWWRSCWRANQIFAFDLIVFVFAPICLRTFKVGYRG